MKETTLTTEQVRAAGVMQVLTSRSFPRWAEMLRPALLKQGIPPECIGAGRSSVYVQSLPEGYLLKFKEADDTRQRDAAQRVAAAAVYEKQGQKLAAKEKRRNA